jgi:hypothetical protein
MGDLADRIGLMKSLIACIVGLTVSIGLLYGAAVFWVPLPSTCSSDSPFRCARCFRRS